MAQLVAIKDLKVDTKGFKDTMRVYAAAINRKGGMVVKQQAGLLASDLLNYTLPVEGTGGGRKGVSKAAQGVGIKTLTRDVESIFKPLHKASYEDIAAQPDYSVFVAWAQDRWRHQKKAGLKRDNINMEGWAAFQQKHKGVSVSNANFTGVNKGETFIRNTHVALRGGHDVQNYSWNVKKNKTTYFLDNGEAKIGAYLKEASKRVGRLKSGWAEACRALGRKPDSASWIDRNQSGNGYAVDESNSTTAPAVTVANRIHFLMGRGAGTTLWKSAFQYRAYAMRNKIAHELTKKAQGDPKRLTQLIEDLRLPPDQYMMQ